MPLQHFTKVFAVTDAKLAQVTADAPGAATAYAASIDLPGIKSFKVTGTVDTKQLRGDNVVLDADSVLTELKVAVEHAKLSIDALAAMGIGAVTDTGTTPAQRAALSMTGPQGVAPFRARPFKLSAVSATADPVNGNVDYVLSKCVLSKFPDLGLAEEDYQTASFEVSTFPCLGTGFKWFDLGLNETALALT